MNPNKPNQPKPAQRNAAPPAQRRPNASTKNAPPSQDKKKTVAATDGKRTQPDSRAAGGSSAGQPKITLYRHTTAPRFGDPALDKIASDITHGLAKRRGEVTVSTALVAQALQSSKNAKWRTSTPALWCEAVHSFLMKSLAHRTKLLTYKASGPTILFKAIWKLPTK